MCPLSNYGCGVMIAYGEVAHVHTRSLKVARAAQTGSSTSHVCVYALSLLASVG